MHLTAAVNLCGSVSVSNEEESLLMRGGMKISGLMLASTWRMFLACSMYLFDMAMFM